MLPCRTSSSNACHHHLLPQEESQVPPASPGGSPRLASVPEPASSPSTASASALRPGVREISCVPCKSGVCVPYNHLDLLNAKHAGFQNQVLWGLIFLCRTPRLGSPSWSSDPLLLREDLCNCDYPHLLVAGLRIWVLTLLYLCSSYPSHCGPLFVSLIVENLLSLS